MKAKLIFFFIIAFFIGIKKGYLYICEVQNLALTNQGIPIIDSVFDSLKEFDLYKKQVIQVIDKNKLKMNSLQLSISKENKIINDKLEKQLEIINFKNNKLGKDICNYSLGSSKKFKFYKTSLNKMLDENNQLITEILEKHNAILNNK